MNMRKRKKKREIPVVLSSCNNNPIIKDLHLSLVLQHRVSLCIHDNPLVFIYFNI